MDKVSWRDYNNIIKAAIEPKNIGDAYAAGTGILSSELSMLMDNLTIMKDHIIEIIKDIKDNDKIKSNDIIRQLEVINTFIDKDIVRGNKSLTKAEGYVNKFKK